MDQPGANSSCLAGQYAWRFRVDAGRQRLFGLGLVYRRISCRIDDDIGFQSADCCCQRFQVSEVTV
ncbi:hypothetical protein D3C80_1790850 [compost metagenome]